MLFIVNWTARPENRDAAFERFVKNGGGLPPAGVKMLGRWSAVGRLTGFAVAEASDPVLLQTWAFDWSDLMEINVYAALTDEQSAPLIAATVNPK